jgi:hypothetical protein
MFSYDGSPVPVRDDLKDSHAAVWDHIQQPGQVFDADQRLSLLSQARNGEYPLDDPVGFLATTLYANMSEVTPALVLSAIAASGEPAVVEAVSLVSMLAAVDNTHRALGADLEPLPEPVPGDPSGIITRGLKKRKTHVPMPRTSITVALDLLPVENAAYAQVCGPHYMTFEEMGSPLFERSPGLNRAQLETIASRTSFFQECFY